MCIRDRDDDLDWEEEVLGEMEGGEPNDRFANYWNDDTGMTYPLIDVYKRQTLSRC